MSCCSCYCVWLSLQANPDYKGVCHVALAQEGHCRPGEVGKHVSRRPMSCTEPQLLGCHQCALGHLLTQSSFLVQWYLLLRLTLVTSAGVRADLGRSCLAPILTLATREPLANSPLALETPMRASFWAPASASSRCDTHVLTGDAHTELGMLLCWKAQRSSSLEG